MNIIQSKEFVKQIKRIKDKKLKERLAKQIKKIINNPLCGKFLAYKNGVRKVYIPPFRLLYAFRNGDLYFLDFNHRSSIYKKYK